MILHISYIVSHDFVIVFLKMYAKKGAFTISKAEIEDIVLIYN